MKLYHLSAIAMLMASILFLSLGRPINTQSKFAILFLANDLPNPDPFTVDYSLGNFSETQQTAINQFLANRIESILSQERRYIVTVQYEGTDQYQHIRLIPAAIYESNWSQPIKDSDIISLFMYQNTKGNWIVEFEPQNEYGYQIQQITTSYSFPWTGGQVWAKTQGFHFNSMGYSLDFAPRNGASNNVLAIEAGTFTPYCYISSDPYQAMVKVTHSGGVESGYLHLAKGSIPSNLFNQSIPKGQIVGSLYTGSVIDNPSPYCTDLANYKFATACGCGYATHLHFETNSLITIQGNPLSAISSATNGTQYTSNNSGGGCCGCTAASSTNAPLFQPAFPGMESNAFTPLPPPDEMDLPSEWTAEEEPEEAAYLAYWESDDPTGMNDIIVSENDGQTAVTPQDDSTPPTGSLDIRGGAVVKSLSVTLELTAVDEGSSVTDMRFSRDGRTWTAWEPFTVYKQWLLDESTKPQTIYAQVRDAVENVSETMNATVTVDLPVSLPASTSYQIGCSVFGIGGGAKSSASYTVRSVTGQPYTTGILQGSNYQVHSGFTGACGGSIYVTPSYHLFVPLIIKR